MGLFIRLLWLGKDGVHNRKSARTGECSAVSVGAHTLQADRMIDTFAPKKKKYRKREKSENCPTKPPPVLTYSPAL